MGSSSPRLLLPTPLKRSDEAEQQAAERITACQERIELIRWSWARAAGEEEMGFQFRETALSDAGELVRFTPAAAAVAFSDVRRNRNRRPPRL